MAQSEQLKRLDIGDQVWTRRRDAKGKLVGGNYLGYRVFSVISPSEITLICEDPKISQKNLFLTVDPTMDPDVHTKYPLLKARSLVTGDLYQTNIGNLVTYVSSTTGEYCFREVGLSRTIRVNVYGENLKGGEEYIKRYVGRYKV